jgi:predicted ArsR family transcriptional regulator
MGASATSSAGSRARVVDALAANGYEPRVDGETVTLENCPFHALAEQQRDLVCGMNVDVVGGVLEGADAPELEACLDPAPGRCCVTVTTR